MLTRRHTRQIIALLLPLMVLRAFLPAGFMPVTGNGELRIVMCSEGLQAPATTTRDDSSTGHQQPSGTGGDCAFAHAATSAPPTQIVFAIVEPLRETRFLSFAATTLPPATGPPRATAARGPPALS